MASTPDPSADPAGGFVLEDARAIAGLDLTLERYRHRSSGARHLHLASPDDVNGLMLGLLTPPEDDSGLTHVLEHMVLCGGRRFPARRAFFAMLWRSACLTMNASASDDCTGFHFATRHRRDFRNLLQVYLDCVFDPRLERADFEREAHRAEPGGDGAPALRPGVVPSEMHGAMSQPPVQLAAALARHLFPGTPYRFNTGGAPERLPELTLARVRAYHRRWYRPSSALFMSCGNVPAREHQGVLEALVLARPAPAGPAPQVRADPDPVGAPLRITESVAPDAPRQVALGWLLGDRRDPTALLEARLLAALLLGRGTTSLRPALRALAPDTRLSPLCGLDESRLRLSFCVALEGLPGGQAAAFESTVLDTLGRVARTGLAADEVDAALEPIELALRSVGTSRHPFGLDLLARLLTPVLHGGDPVAQLELPAALARLRRDALTPGHLASRIRALLLDNPHRVRLTLTPKTAASAARHHAVVSTPHDVGAGETRDDTLPELRVADLDPPPVLEDPVPEAFVGLRLGHARRHCGGLVHQAIALLPPAMDQDVRDALPLLVACLEHRDGGAAVGIAGGLAATLPVRGAWGDPARAHAALVLSARSLPAHQEAVSERMATAIDGCVPADAAALREILTRARAGLAARSLARGHDSARYLAAAAGGGGAALRERWRGLTRLLELDRLLDDARPEALDAALERLRQLTARLAVAPREGLIVSDARAPAPCVRTAARHWQVSRPEAPARGWSVAAQGAPGSVCAAQIPGPTGFAARAWQGPAPGHRDAPALAVLGPLLTAGFLHRRIRELGGAYGTGARYCLQNGAFSVFSFRDPCPLETLAAFDDGMHWLREQRHDERALEHAKIAVLRGLDGAWSAPAEAHAAFTDTVLGHDGECLRQFRDAVLALGAGDLERACHELPTPQACTSVVLANAGVLRAAAGKYRSLRQLETVWPG